MWTPEKNEEKKRKLLSLISNAQRLFLPVDLPGLLESL